MIISATIPVIVPSWIVLDGAVTLPDVGDEVSYAVAFADPPGSEPDDLRVSAQVSVIRRDPLRVVLGFPWCHAVAAVGDVAAAVTDAQEGDTLSVRGSLSVDYEMVSMPVHGRLRGRVIRRRALVRHRPREGAVTSSVVEFPQRWDHRFPLLTEVPGYDMFDWHDREHTVDVFIDVSDESCWIAAW